MTPLARLRAQLVIALARHDRVAELALRARIVRADRPMCVCGVRGGAELHRHPGWSERAPR